MAGLADLTGAQWAIPGAAAVGPLAAGPTVEVN